MSTYQIRSDPKRQFTGLAAVVLFHVIVIYALVSGLAKSVIDVARAPIEARLIEEVKPKPAAPPPKPPPAPKIKFTPPPAYIPPPDMPVTPPPVAPPVVATPVEPPKVEPPPAPPHPVQVALTVACPRQVDPVMPPRAERDGISGSVEARLTVKGGKVVAVDILKSTPRGVFDEAVREAVRQYGCVDNGDQSVIAIQQFEFTSGG